MQHVDVAIPGVPTPLAQIDRALQSNRQLRLLISSKVNIRIECLGFETPGDTKRSRAWWEMLAERSGAPET